MAEYIEKGQLVKDLLLLADVETGIRQHAILGCASTIQNRKAADVAPVRRGRWVNDHGVIGCSCCMMGVERRTEDERKEWVDLSKMPFCPACGARMDGGDPDA